MNEEELLAIARQELAQESAAPSFSPEQHSTFLEVARRELAQEDPISYGSVWDIAKKAIYDIPKIPGALYDAAKPITRAGTAAAANLVGEINPADTYGYFGLPPEQYSKDVDSSLRTIGKGAAATAGAGLSALTGPLAPITAPILASAGMKGFDYLNRALGNDAPATPTQDFNELLYNTIQGGAVSGGISAASKAVGTASNALGKIADSAENSGQLAKEKALGVGYGDKKSSLGKAPVYLDDSGNIVPKELATNVEAPIQQQLQLLDKNGFFERARQSGQDANSIAAQLANEQALTGQKISALIGEADNALSGKVGSITPKFPRANAYLNKLGEESPSTQRSLQPIIDEIKNDYNSVARVEIDPSTRQPVSIPLSPLEKINSVKRGLNEKANFWNSNNDTAKATLYRSAYQDLQSLERQVFDAALPSKAGEFAAANDLYAAQSTFGKTVNKPLASQSGGILKQLTTPAGSAPVVGAGALASAFGLPWYVGAGAGWLGRSALKGFTNNNPLTMADVYSNIGTRAGGAASLADALSGKIAGAATPAAQITSLSQAASDNVNNQLNTQQTNIGQLADALVGKNSVPQPMAKPPAALPISSEGMATEDAKIAQIKMDPALINAQIQVESSGNPNAIGPATKYGRAKGLMQLLDTTGKELMDRLGLPGDYDPFNPELNKTLGTAYMSQLVDRYGSTDLALAAYNWGMGNLEKLMRKVGSQDYSMLRPYLPSETRNYVEKINKLKNQQVIA